MAKSATFSVVNASGHSSDHNSRDDKPEYLIGIDEGEENVYDLRHSDSNFLALAQAKYKEMTGQKMQQKQIDALIKETVLSLEKHHTEADVQKIFDTLNEKYGGHYVTELSIHRDEGHFEDKTGVTYYPTKDILQKEDGWYIVPLDQSLDMKPSYKPKEHEFSEKVDIAEFKPVHNVHAHVKFSMFDLETGKTGRMKHNELNDRIKTAAQVLKLEYNPEKSVKGRTTVSEIKTQHKAVRNEKIKALNKGLAVEKLPLTEVYNGLKGVEQFNMRMEMRAIVGERESDGIELGSVKKRLELSEKDNKTLKEEIQALKEAQKAERAELKDQGATRADYAQMEAKYKAEIEQLKAGGNAPKIDPIEIFEQIEEITKPIDHPLGEKELVKKDASGREIDPIDELIRASTTTVEEKGMIFTTQKQVFDQNAFIQKVRERENEHQKLHKEKNGLIKALEYGKERMKTALKDVFEKFTGKPMGLVKFERDARVELQKEQQRKEREIDRPKSRGLERC